MPTKARAPQKTYTLALARMEHHYSNQGLIAADSLGRHLYHAPAWTNERVNRFCRLRGCTVEEMAMFFLVSPTLVKNYFATNQWPSVLALHLQHHEAYMLSQLTNAEHLVWPPNVFVGPPNDFCPQCGRENQPKPTEGTHN